MKSPRIPLQWIVCLSLICGGSSAFAAQEEDVLKAEAAAVQADKEDLDPGGSEDAEIDDEKAKEDDGPIVDSSATAEPEPIDRKFIRLHMWDGAIVGGEVAVDAITVQTEFGTLAIPIDRIRSFYPGLDSFPERDDQIQQWVTELGDRDYGVREQAHRALQNMGLQLRDQMKKFDDGGSAERKKHLADLRKEMDELQQDLDDDDDADQKIDRALIRGDMVHTPDFSIVGKIQQPSFQIDSRYGTLKIRLQDIRFADRAFNQPKTDIRKSVAVSGATFFQKVPKSTRVRVNKGDRISIRASGSINWTNWNSVASPDGLTNQGNWNGINSGALAARIGKNGSIVKIGAKASFVAKESGVLYLAIAMQDNYVRNTGYRWDGEFTAKVVVSPKAK